MLQKACIVLVENIEYAIYKILHKKLEIETINPDSLLELLQIVSRFQKCTPEENINEVFKVFFVFWLPYFELTILPIKTQTIGLPHLYFISSLILLKTVLYMILFKTNFGSEVWL